MEDEPTKEVEPPMEVEPPSAIEPPMEDGPTEEAQPTSSISSGVGGTSIGTEATAAASEEQESKQRPPSQVYGKLQRVRA